MPRQGKYTQQQVDEALNEYVRPKECSTTDLPRDLPPDKASNYIRDNLKPDFGHSQMGRAMRVARYFVLRDRAVQLVGMLNPNPRDANELQRTCHLVVAICELGNQTQQDTAVDAYQKTVGGRMAEDSKNLELLVETFFHLPASADKKPISERVAKLRADAEQKGNDRELWLLEECERRLLPRIVQEKARRDWLIRMPAGPERNRQWAEAYLMYEMKTPFKWDEAAGFGLLRQARDEGDAAAIEALRAAMKRVDPDKDKPDEVKFRKTRGYNARSYFLEPFDADTRRDAKDSSALQDDLIK